MESIKYELKYCERCGTLNLRPVSSTTTYCMLCERLLQRYRLGKRADASITAGLKTPLPDIPLCIASTNTTGRMQ